MTDLTAPELKLMQSHWFVEIGAVDGGGIGHWIETTESVEVRSKETAEALKAEWLASGKLVTTHWGEVRPATPYGLFRIRQEWRQIPLDTLTRRAANAHGRHAAWRRRLQHLRLEQGRRTVSNLIERLLNYGARSETEMHEDREEAADALAAMDAEIARLTAHLETMLQWADTMSAQINNSAEFWTDYNAASEFLERAALTGENGND